MYLYLCGSEFLTNALCFICRFLISATGHFRQDAIERFNANVAYSGLLYSVNQDVRKLLFLQIYLTT